MTNYLFILNDPAYGTERSYNGLRLAGSLARREHTTVRVFLMGDAVGCAMAGQQTPNGYYKLDHMIAAVTRHGGEVDCCGTCLDARGITDAMLTTDTRRATLEELTDWTLAADQTLVF
jgi:uncharacterized protein involved in oxidation of intracellular sulfur